jgi:hypothetical protein
MPSIPSSFRLMLNQGHIDIGVSPRIVGAKVPDVTFKIAAREPTPAIVFVFDLQQDLGSGSFRLRAHHKITFTFVGYLLGD